ncbi:eukaryotic translation initiation factor 2 subunit 1 [Actinidia rufa]|uniref:Eukaryotic translation initiation factor 2 subunit 1 n=1 Tax=Actinidia rufa TaxID=165716 RepID=A0A7J0E6P7_9ERIC|nr:eukaryotic translation initiation factor 2 subunit 1 [Actinidia rufa]
MATNTPNLDSPAAVSAASAASSRSAASSPSWSSVSTRTRATSTSVSAESPRRTFRSARSDTNKSKLVHSIMRHVAETLQLDLEDLYVHVGWPLYRKYGHAFEAFKVIVNDPDSVINSLTREVKEIGPDGQAVTKVVPAMTEEVKDALVKNIRRRMTPQPLKIRADIEMKCFQFDGVLHIKEAMRKAEAAGNKDCPVKIKLVAPPAYVLNTQTLDKEQGIAILNKAITACSEEIERHKGKLTVKEAARAVSEREDKLLAEQMAKLGRENEEVSGDEDSEEEEDTGMGDVDLDNSGTGITE